MTRPELDRPEPPPENLTDPNRHPKIRPTRTATVPDPNRHSTDLNRHSTRTDARQRLPFYFLDGGDVTPARGHQ